MLTRKLILGIVIVALILGGTGYWAYANNYLASGPGSALGPASTGNDWKPYRSKAWDRHENLITFSYPPDWHLAEKEIDGKLDTITLTGDGYEVTIDRKGRGASPDWTARDVGGFDARVWESQESTQPLGSVPEDGLDYTVLLGVIEPGFIIRARTSDPETELLDRFLSTVEFEMTP